MGHGRRPRTARDKPLGRLLDDGEAELLQEFAHLLEVGRAEPDERDIFDFDRAHAASSVRAHSRSVLANSCGSWPCIEWPIAGKDW